MVLWMKTEVINHGTSVMYPTYIFIFKQFRNANIANFVHYGKTWTLFFASKQTKFKSIGYFTLYLSVSAASHHMLTTWCN